MTDIEVIGTPRAWGLSGAWRFVRQLAARPPGALGLFIVALLFFVALLAPLLATHDPFAQSLSDRLVAPSSAHWFGTDELGRDIYSRVIYGTRLTVYIVGIVLIVAAPVGLALGCVAGYFGGWVDGLLMRITDIFLSLPGLVLALALVTALGPGLENAIVAISITMWPPIARLARAEVMSFRGREYIAVMQLQGASALRIIVRHIVPMCMPSVIVRVTLNMAAIILVAAGLGFLGLGAQPPSPEWGAMLSKGREYLSGYWWMSTMPGTAILVVSLGFNLLGDALRDVLDPRSA